MQTMSYFKQTKDKNWREKKQKKKKKKGERNRKNQL